MKLNDAINIAQSTHWTKINNFYIEIYINNESFAKKCKWKATPEFRDKLNTALISCTTPTYTNAQVEAYTAYQWRFAQGHDEAYKFTLTFRDFNQMELYNTFRALYTRGREEYFDTISMSVLLWLDEDHDVAAVPVFYTNSAIIESISTLNFSHNTKNQIAEFSVELRCDVQQDP